MSKLRKMIWQVNWYVKLIMENPEKARDNCKEYIKDVERLKRRIEIYIQNNNKDRTRFLYEEFLDFESISTDIWFKNDRNIFSKVKGKTYLLIINNHLNELSKNLKRARILQKNIEYIQFRLNQFDNMSVYSKGPI